MRHLAYQIKTKNEKGVALILALMLMTALSLLTVNSFEMLSSSIRIAANHKDDLQALYVAEAGIEDGVQRMRSTGGCSDFTGSVGGYQYTVTVTTVGTNLLKFLSVGNSGNFPRTLEAEVKVVGTPEYPDPDNYSVAVMYWKEKEM